MSCITTKHWSAKIADKNSLLLQESRNFMPRRALKTNLFVAKLAETNAKPREAKARQNARCTMRFAQVAEILVRFRSSLVKIVRYIAASASRSDRREKTDFAVGFFLFLFLIENGGRQNTFCAKTVFVRPRRVGGVPTAFADP